MRFLAVVIVLAAAVCAERVSYEGYKVYRVLPTSENQLKLLAGFSKNIHFDFWTEPRAVGKNVDVMVDPRAQELFVWFLGQNSIQYYVWIDNVERVAEQERIWQLAAPPLDKGRISFTKYNNHDEINAYLDQLAEEHSDIASVETIGNSYEGRDMKLIKISKNANANNPVIFVDAGIHAREWAAPAQATYIINQLVENSDNANLLENVDWHILPVLNPDGYEYSRTENSYWRKTRSAGKICRGTDGNRNFGFHWGEVGASSIECADTYMGSEPFSEIETQAVRDHILRNKDRVKLYLTFHSYGEYLLFPWGFTSALPDDYDELQGLGETVAEAIRAVAGTKYTVGTSTNVLYAAAGGSDDWAKGVAGIELSYTIELPGGNWGFHPPTHQILPIVTETWEGVKAYHQYIEEKFGK